MTLHGIQSLSNTANMGLGMSTYPPQGGGGRRWILGEKFDTVARHKGSIKLLWETKWRAACEKSIYPFYDGKLEDFEPIFQTLIAENINDAYSDSYTERFFPVAKSLEQEASMAFYNGDSETASDLLRRAAVVYRISRFPYVSPDDKETNIKRKAFTRQKAAYLTATSVWKNPLTEHVVPHTHRAGRDGPRIPVYIRLPENTIPGSHYPVPAVLIMTGLDEYRPDNSQRTHEITARGWGVVVAEIPGTADSPADPADPESADRLWSSILEYMRSLGAFDMTNIVVWGLSAGGYYAVRAAHTHRGRLKGCIAHGPGTHYFLDEEWLARVEDHEYPFPIIRAWAKKYGYEDPAEFCKEARKKFSLLGAGILDLPSTRLLLLNGIDDGVTPIEDCYLLFSYGSPKEGRFFPGLPHMGCPASLGAAYKWLEDVLGCDYVKN